KTYVQDLATSNVLAGFSSRGPTDVDFRVKPDVTSPGVNVLSSIPGSGTETCVPAFSVPCWAFFQGTSMATPHLAGSAAVVLGQHPSWPAWAVRSAVVNTADENVLKTSNGTCCDTDVNDVGSGRENLSSAVNASLAFDPVSVNFGAVPSGSGQTKSMSVSVMNLTSGTLALPATSITGTTGQGLYGLVVRGPTKPVCSIGEPCSEPAAKTKLRFLRGGSVVSSVVTDMRGRYRVQLRPGLYTVRVAGVPAGGLGGRIDPDK